MVTFNLAYTAPINPSGASPVLTQAQVWEGLKIKVRAAQEFVPVITGCDVVSEETSPAGNLQVTRDVKFKPGGPSKTEAREVCVHYAPCRVVFEQEDGSTVTNVVSRDAGGNLMMSYVFEWRHPGMSEGSEEVAKLEEGHWKMAKMAVESSIDTIRRMVKEGRIKA
ncbi:hypothetical protein F5Y15DRAFT_268674 [Xylariaceae sp. FL0016]|nr:hypothetical protein F5Y15DRAFT_268674 [Xylariaceae sp. FL0016]